MIYVFENGRVLYEESLLTESDNGKFIAFEKLPDFEKIEGKTPVIIGCDLLTCEVKVEYVDII